MNWSDLTTTAGQLSILIALTGLTYRLLRLVWPDIPEAVMQFLAAIFSSVMSLGAMYRPDIPRYQWLLLGVSSGLLMSQNVIKSIDWVTSAKSATGAVSLGISKKPPQWYVDLHPELFPKTNGAPDASAPPTPKGPVTPLRVDPPQPKDSS